MPRMAFTDRGVRAIPAPAKPREARFFENRERGLTLMLNVSYRGTRSWHVLYYRNGRPSTKKLGVFPDMTVADARKAANKSDPKKLAASNNAGKFKTVAEAWLNDKVRDRLRSAVEIERQLTTYVYPVWGDRPIFQIKRADVNQLLRDIEAKRIRRGRRRLGGVVMADAVLATLRSLTQWYAVENDEYPNPIIRGMKRDKRSTDEKSRARILTDDELRTVWAACDDAPIFGAVVRMLLLTGQRLRKVARMKRTEVSDGTWTIATESREKGNAGAINLPQMALDVLEGLPRIQGCPYVFPSASGKKHFNSFSQGKAAFDELLPDDMEPWTLHDLRRTSRSLMSRVGVTTEIAERVLGHKRKGVERVYDRFAYTEEKSAALQKLADCIALILNPPEKENVVQLKPR